MSLLERLFGRKPEAGTPPGLDDLRWGTTQPVLARVGGEPMGLRAFGTLSCAVSDPQLFARHFAEVAAEELRLEVQNRAGMLVVAAVTDQLGELSASRPGLQEILAATDEVAGGARVRVEQRLAALGLSLNRLVVDSINRAP